MRRVWLWHAVPSYTLNARTHNAHISYRDRLGRSSAARGPRTARSSPAPPSPPSEVGRHEEKVQHFSSTCMCSSQNSFSSEICSTCVSTQRRQQLCWLAVTAAAAAAVLACSLRRQLCSRSWLGNPCTFVCVAPHPPDQVNDPNDPRNVHLAVFAPRRAGGGWASSDGVEF